MDKFSFVNNADVQFIEELYQRYKANPEDVDVGWRKFFDGFEFARKSYDGMPEGKFGGQKEFNVIDLINDYRKRGHLFTQTNPVRTRRKYSPKLDIENFGLSQDDLETEFEAGSEIGIGKAKLKDIIGHLKTTYCQSIGAEYMYIRDVEMQRWLKEKMESKRNTPQFSMKQKTNILRKLSEAVYFENFLQKKYPGQKRFSLEGAESLIPALDSVIEKGAALGNEEFIIGMPHRGRLNVLTNILEKGLRNIFSEFENKEYSDEKLLGDVKYHLGYSSSRSTISGKEVKLSLSPNPSHLEAVDPVVEGITRAKLDQIYGGDQNKMTPILIHGDASIAAQGVVYEVLQMSGLGGYTTGGTIHLVVNNQLGFTTNYLDGRTSTYCTDVGKTIQSPIFHVNGDDVEAVVYTILLAMEFRQKFHKDVFIDLLCYRKYGHNEGDEPRFTQPLLYKTIAKHPNPRDIYVDRLINEGATTREAADQVKDEFTKKLEEGLSASKEEKTAKITSFLEDTWKDIKVARPSDFDSSPNTGVDQKKLKEIAHKITDVPKDKNIFRKLVKLMNQRRDMVDKTDKLDWGMAELLAYGSLLDEGIPVRLSGQDSQRGTFSHRHSVLTIEDSEEKYVPLNNISPKQATFDIYNSPLSEYGVLGFEYGYSLASPYALTIWEAQFGDFNNGGQVIIDQYISSAEEKWRVMNDLVMLLPHGYEGQGPEHSSGRMERFLSLSAHNNMQITNPTTPANFFHLLRRQLHRDFRKPLIVFTPKSLLRHSRCVSSLHDLSTGGFKEVIDDDHVDPKKVNRLIFCSGKVYYDLLEEREKNEFNNTAIIRLEQLYPLPRKQIRGILEKYNNIDQYLWVQEEPANMGAWAYIQRNMKNVSLLLVARPESGSPATGSPKLHEERQRKIMEKAFGECQCHRRDESCRMVCAPKEWSIGSKHLQVQESNNKKAIHYNEG
ncbi:MAG: 2-oxoglutarate dehydrogenase E1 component [Bacteroidales bacterium]|nr:2-oxoglutarate dehydrogenase E1 component [Bacteroidales bacterium]